MSLRGAFASLAMTLFRNRAMIFQKCFTRDEEVRVRLDVDLSHQADDVTDRQPHHAGETAVHVSHGLKLGMLNGVRARLVEWIAGLHVGIDLLIRVVTHGHLGHAEIFEQKPVAWAEKGNPAVDLVYVP